MGNCAKSLAAGIKHNIRKMLKIPKMGGGDFHFHNNLFLNLLIILIEQTEMRNIKTNFITTISQNYNS